MKKINLKKQILKSLAHGVFAFLFLAATLIIPSKATSADGIMSALDSAPTRAQYETARFLENTLNCIGYGSNEGGKGGSAGEDTSRNQPWMREEISKEDALNANFIKHLSNRQDDDFPTGHDYEGGDDGYEACNLQLQKFIGLAATVADYGLGLSPDDLLEFTQLFYLLNGDKYSYNAGGAPAMARDLLNKPFVKAAKSGEIRLVRLAVAFSQCFDEAPSGTKPKDSDTPNLSEPYFYRKNKEANSNITIGYKFSPSAGNDYKCSTLAEMAGTEGFLELMAKYKMTTGTLFNNPQNFYAALRADERTDSTIEEAYPDILEILSNAPDNVVTACLAFSGLPTTISLERITEWLISGDNTDLNWQTSPQSSTSATDDQATKLFGCLIDEENIPELKPRVEQFRDDVAAIETAYESFKENTDSTSGEGSATDDCLQKSDAFIAWAACPIVNMVDSFLEFVENMIQSFLQFDLDKQDETGGLKSAWNIFRSLATMLIMAGFLLALVVKGVKGE